MAASSVTGVGIGDSNGKYKPQNNCGCGCVEGNELLSQSKEKTICFKKIKTCYSIYKHRII